MVLKNILDKILICHITNHISTMTENLFHESNEKLKEEYFYIGMMIDNCYLINGCKSTYINVFVLQFFMKISQNRD